MTDDSFSLCFDTLQLAAEMNGMAIRRSSKSEGGLASANSALIPRSLLRGASLFFRYATISPSDEISISCLLTSHSCSN